MDKREWSGLHEIASGEMTAETVRELFKTTMNYHTWHGSGWKVVIANEADNMSDKAAFIWLDILEHLPAKCVVVFTTNDADKLPSRFRQRCECHSFKNPVHGFNESSSQAEIEAQKLIDHVWQSELGHNHSPKLEELDGWIEGGHVSFRSVLSSLEPMIRIQRELDQEQLDKIKNETPAAIQHLPVFESKPRISVSDIMSQIQIAIKNGDFTAAKKLEQMLA